MSDTAEENRGSEDRAVWSLNRDDKRLLYVTFLGGLAANVGLVLIVGLGVAVARQLATGHPDQFARIFVYAGLAMAGVGILIGFFMMMTGLNMTPGRPASRMLLRVALSAFAVFCSVLLIGVIGAAAGIK